MSQRVSQCIPARDLLQYSGFYASKDGKRLIWENTTENMMFVKYIHDILSPMIIQNPSNNINKKKQKNPTKSSSKNEYKTNSPSVTRKQTNNDVQTQHDATQLISNLIMNQSVPFGSPQSSV